MDCNLYTILYIKWLWALFFFVIRFAIERFYEPFFMYQRMCN